jgi:hypothetical protein
MAADALNSLDAHFAAELGSEYDPQAYIGFVQLRQAKGIKNSGKIRTGLVFERNSGLPYDYIEWVREAAKKPAVESPPDDRAYWNALAADNAAREERERQIDARIAAMPMGEFLRRVNAEALKVRKERPMVTAEMAREIATTNVRRRLGEEIAEGPAPG